MMQTVVLGHGRSLRAMEMAARRLKPVSWILLAVCGSMIVQKWVRYGGSEHYDLWLSIVYNVTTILPFIVCLLLALVVAKATRRYSQKWRFVLASLTGLITLFLYVVAVSAMLYLMGLATSWISAPFISKYVSGLGHLHLALYLAVHYLLAEPSKERAASSDHSGELFGMAVAEVVRIESAGHYVWIHTRTARSLQRARLADLEAKLPASFLRVHRGHLVNQKHITGIIKRGRKTHLDVAGDRIPVSLRHRPKLEGLQSLV